MRSTRNRLLVAAVLAALSAGSPGAQAPERELVATLSGKVLAGAERKADGGKWEVSVVHQPKRFRK
jgi:hypothetical protein